MTPSQIAAPDDVRAAAFAGAGAAAGATFAGLAAFPATAAGSAIRVAGEGPRCVGPVSGASAAPSRSGWPVHGLTFPSA